VVDPPGGEPGQSPKKGAGETKTRTIVCTYRCKGAGIKKRANAAVEKTDLEACWGVGAAGQIQTKVTPKIRLPTD